MLGNQAVLNYGNTLQVIKNMPEDEDKWGRLRDHLAIILEGADVRLKGLKMQEELAEVVADSKQSLLDIELSQQRQKSEAREIMDEVMHKLEASFSTFALTEEQEDLLLKIVQAGVDRSQDNFDQGLKVDEPLRGIIDRLAPFSR